MLQGMKTLSNRKAQEKATATAAAAEVYPCRVRQKPCVDEPQGFAEQALQCDHCQRWIHYCCGDVEGKKVFDK